MANHPFRIHIQAPRVAPSESDSESSDHGPPSESLDEDDVDASEASDDEAERAMDELLKLALPPAWERQLGRFRVRQQRQFVPPKTWHELSVRPPIVWGRHGPSRPGE
jgi:hypothetical protein